MINEVGMPSQSRGKGLKELKKATQNNFEKIYNFREAHTKEEKNPVSVCRDKIE